MKLIPYIYDFVRTLHTMYSPLWMIGGIGPQVFHSQDDNHLLCSVEGDGRVGTTNAPHTIQSLVARQQTKQP